MAENTFLGLQPYTEADAYRFKGRTEESQELFRLIVRNDYTVCYAESGEGKTSLLNAGVFPLLRRNMFFPIAITFMSDDYERTPDNFDTIIDRCIKDSIADYNEKNKGINIEYKLCSTDFQDTDCQSALQQELSKYSWWKLRNYKPQAMGLTFTPVFVFDQFEEVFNLPGSIVWTKKFFDWLEDVSSDSCPDEIIQKVRSIIGNKAAFPAIREEKDFKGVFSLRKEFNGELDYWGMQKCFIPSLKDNRYCLKALTYEGAKKVMTQQQRFEETKVEQVLRYFVQQYSREPEKTIAENLPVIPALLLSIVCDSWEKDINYFSDIDANGIDDSLNKILEKFYDEALSAIVNELSQKEVNSQPESIREDIETAIFALVDSNGKRVRRKSSELSHLDFDAKYKEILSDKRIIKISKVDGEDYVEIVHDSLCPIIAKRKELYLAAEAKRREEEKLREQAKKNRKRVSVLSGIILIALVIIGFFYYQNAKIQEQRDKAENAEAEAVLINVNNLVSNGQLIDAATNLRHIIDNLNSKYNDKIRSHTFIILRNLYFAYNYDTEYDKIVAHNGQVCDMGFNSDGSMIATCSNDQTVRVWSTLNGQLIREYPLKSDVLDIWSSDDVNTFFDTYDKKNPIVVKSCYKTYSSISTGANVGKRNEETIPSFYSGNTILSPDGTWALSEKDGVIFVYKEKELKTTIRTESGESIGHMEFTFDNSRFLIYGRTDILNGHVKEYSVEGKQLKHVDFTQDDYVSTHGCIYLPNTYDMLYIEYKKGPLVIKEDGQIIPYNGGTGTQVIAINPIANIVAFGGRDGRLVLQHYDSTLPYKLANHRDSLFFVTEMKQYDDGMETMDEHIRDSYGGLYLKSLYKKAYIVDRKNGDEIELSGHQNNIGNVIFNRTHDMVITRAFDNTIRFWSVKTGKEIDSLRISVSGYGNQSIACSRDNKYLVSSSDDMLYVWEIETGDVVFSMPCEGVQYSCFSTEGDKILFTSGFDNKEKDVKCVDFPANDYLIKWFDNIMPKREGTKR